MMIVKDTSVVVPGLGLSALHEQGYTGKVVNVAVIDGPLRAEHEEFGDRLAHYETIVSMKLIHIMEQPSPVCSWEAGVAWCQTHVTAAWRM